MRSTIFASRSTRRWPLLLTTSRGASRIEMRLDPTDAELTATIGTDSPIEPWPPPDYRHASLAGHLRPDRRRSDGSFRAGDADDHVREADARCANHMTTPLDERQVDESEVLRLFERIPEDATAGMNSSRDSSRSRSTSRDASPVAVNPSKI